VYDLIIARCVFTQSGARCVNKVLTKIYYNSYSYSSFKKTKKNSKAWFYIAYITIIPWNVC